MVGNQSGYIVGFVLFAFFVYITLKGELPIYAGLLLLSPSTTPATAPATQSQKAAQSNSNLTSALSAGFGAFFGGL